jgi:tetratricopeptide (TPR) repeat protein
MAKYRYLPRIFRAWIATSELAPASLEAGDWEALQEAYDRLDNAITAMPLYTSAVEGSRSTKRKKKSDAQKAMMKAQSEYKLAVEDFGKAIERKDKKRAADALSRTTTNMAAYREMAQIDKEDGGVIRLPEGNPEEAGHAGAPLGYVVPVLRGGGTKNDYALR